MNASILVNPQGTLETQKKLRKNYYSTVGTIRYGTVRHLCSSQICAIFATKAAIIVVDAVVNIC